MTTHHLPTSIDHKLDQIKSSLDEVVEKLDALNIMALIAKDTSDNYELECSVCTGDLLPEFRAIGSVRFGHLG